MTLIEILERLKQPIPNDLLSQKSLKGNSIDYVAWYDLTEILDNRCGLGNWEWSIKDVNQVGNNLTLIGVLTIHGEDRHLTMMATGTESVNCSGYGDPSSNAEAMSLRRCCAKFGLGRDLWRKDKPKQSSSNKPIKGEISREDWLKRKAQQA
ncbi:DUF1071 domain-containing protein [Crocosphaera sp. UHCC 0190]|uniref:DUF1071 domain-containing protein n=1 Tax=Crocosphaera sp. UHCC 0190 TaxID=3110246 RepID=UPI002B1F024A|nr:DUF1071 domain-containing protein [Crocosphaera sp. UHCC 0190]MEA5511978.1 DUF1071 domain-containing protein [Crocosphaera sp. UHCC 0190]